ncbi:MAG: transcription-repair coupling factor [Ruminococcaceae bacterium]|nr:transcription-repair coupling factor [Oscillospiraceae bacterium]
MRRLTSLITADKEFESLISLAKEELRKDEKLPIAVNGLSGGAHYAFITEATRRLFLESKAPVLILAGSDSERDSILECLLAAGVKAAAYKKRDFVFHNISASHDAERERLSVLLSLADCELEAVVTTSDAAVGATIPYERLIGLATTLELGANISPDELSQRLDTMGFKRVDSVEAAGQYARRGGIVDFFVNSEQNPVRVEFFGDEIDRIVAFDVITQRAVEVKKSVKILPALEVMLDGEAEHRIKNEIKKLISKATEEDSLATLKRELAAIESHSVLDSRDKFLGIIYDKCETLLSYFEAVSARVVLNVGTNDGEELLKKHVDSIRESAKLLIDNSLVSERCVRYCASYDDYKKFLSSSVSVHINPFSGISGIPKLSGLFSFRTRRTVGYGKNPSMLLEDVSSLSKSGYRIVIECPNRASIDSVTSLLVEAGYLPVRNESGEININEMPTVMLTIGTLDGFDLIGPKVALLSMAEDEGRAVMSHRRRQRILRRSGGAGQKIMSYAELEIGDYVVHANYGIGLFEGIQSVRIDGVTRDYITIKYAGTDKLFVPCDRLEMIGKYIGARENDGTVKLSKMGGTDWHKTKSKAKTAAKDMAAKLIKLYAERERLPGFAFPPDSELEEEFASSFEHEETDSQIQAIEEIKADMMKPVPMNRLLCGDVGFGKTEVALRAAFKAIMGGKQVAILVPTTILALQHYSTAQSRMRGYPVNVEMLTRFKTPKQQEKIKNDLKNGKIDIIIGTHKLLAKDIEFKNLGLLIVDEEQRFGVGQKEKLKEMSTNIDVLTLSATPIPRTLNMAINGINDMSVLDEAPENRRPIQTYVLEHDDVIIEDAIRREIRRGGQVLYLFNNIDTISYVAGKIMRAVPEARVAYAHGRMERDEIEDIWQALVSGEIDVLVCTTIIETGVDLPMANTLIIENADKMGLSQLHQIRGRVGRSERQAYAFFTYRAGKVLSEIATKRLSAIREYAEFGAGFKVALRDLEIRGAGNLLGKEQHGYIDSVGYDLYVKLLEEAVLEEKGESSPKLFESTIDFKVDAHIPGYYITANGQRMDIYKKISLIKTPKDRDEIYDELIDRFGDPPKSVLRLLSVALCRAIAERARVPRIEHKGSSILFYMEKPDLSVWSMVLASHKGKLVGSGGAAPIVYRLQAGEDPLKALLSVLTDYYNNSEN